MLREYLLSIDELTEDDKQLLLKNLPDLIKATPRTDLAVSIWKSVLKGKKTSRLFFGSSGKNTFHLTFHFKFQEDL